MYEGIQGIFSLALLCLNVFGAPARNHVAQIVKGNRALGIRILKASIDGSEGLLINLHNFSGRHMEFRVAHRSKDTKQCHRNYDLVFFALLRIPAK